MLASAVAGFSQLAPTWSEGACTVYRAREGGSLLPVMVAVVELGQLSRHTADRFRSALRALPDLGVHPNIAVPHRVELSEEVACLVADSRQGFWPEWSTALPGRPASGMGHPAGAVGHPAGRMSHPARRPVHEVLTAGVGLSRALDAAHSRGLVHRDLRPETVVAASSGGPALWGFALSTVRGAGPIAAALSAGSPWHLAPETLESGMSGPPADVYALGSTIYQVLAGKPPFAVYQGESRAAMIVRILRDPILPLPRPDVPLPLHEMLAATMSKDPEARPDAVDLAAALDQIASSDLEGTPVVAVSSKAADTGAAQAEGDETDPPRSRHRRPAVVAPTRADRHVVTPFSAGRGQPSHPLSRPEVPLPPLSEGGSISAADRPVFVDPQVLPVRPGDYPDRDARSGKLGAVPPDARPGEAGSRSAGLLVAARGAAGPSSLRERGGRGSEAFGLAAIAIAVAAAVVIAGLLLAFGLL